MKQHLRIFMALLVFMICGGVSFGQKVTLDFTTNSWKLPTSGGKAETQYSNGTYTISVSAATEYKFSSSGYLYMGKTGSALTLPAFNFDVEKIVVTGRSGASSAVKQNIYVGSKAVSTETTGATGVNSYLIADGYQSAGNVYVLKVTSKHNTQITKIEIYEKSNKTETSLTFPNTSYTFDKDSGDKTFTNAAVLNPTEAGSVTYKSSNEKLAVVSNDGLVLVSTDNVGTATITASFAGNDKYKASEASYTIEVKGVEETFDFTKPENYGYSAPALSKGTNMPEGSSMIAGAVTILNVNNGSTETRFWNNNDKITFRIYKGAKLQVTVPDGYAIYSITTTPDNSKAYTLAGLNTNIVSMSVTSNITNLTGMTVAYFKLPTATLTTAASGFSTYAADYAVNYTEAGLKAYAVKVSDDKTKVSYTECTGVVPAGKAVLVKGEANNEYTLTPATEDADATFDTDLQISDGNVTADGTTFFAFGTKNNVSGFKIVKSGVVIPEKKGYLVVANASAAKDFFAFDDSTNGIDDPTIEIGEEEVPLFNLAGQRVGKDYKGIVVKNGKKYVNK